MADSSLVAISIYEPFASLICLGLLNTSFTMSWKTEYRGELYIHTRSKLDDYHKQLFEYFPFSESLHQRQIQHIEDIPLGYIIGQVKLVHCIPAESVIPSEFQRICRGNYTPGHYIWKFAETRLASNPVRSSGRSRLYHLSKRFKLTYS